MKYYHLESYPARARSDPGIPAGVRGDPQGRFALRVDPPELFRSRGQPPEVWQNRNGPPAGSAQEPCERIASALFLRLSMTKNGTSLRTACPDGDREPAGVWQSALKMGLLRTSQ